MLQESISAVPSTSNKEQNVEVNTLEDFHDRVVPTLDMTWSNQTSPERPITAIKLCKISSEASTSSQPLVITHTLLVNVDLSWELFVHGHKVDAGNTKVLSSIPFTLISFSSFRQLLDVIQSSTVCTGNPDPHFVGMIVSRKGKLLSPNGEIKAQLDSGFPVANGKQTYSKTVRTINCELLVNGEKCINCSKYRCTLRSLHSRYSSANQDASMHTNDRYLKTPQRTEKLKSLRSRCKFMEIEVKRLKTKIQESSDSKGVSVDEPLHQELRGIMVQRSDSILKAYPEGSFKRLFWDQQLKAATVMNAAQMRWHPTMIRWCLNLKYLSSAAYHSLRSSGFIRLPSERTLRDYSHVFKVKCGFQSKVDKMLLEEASKHGLLEWKKFIVILIDEMKLRESLVYDKHHHNVIGFVHLSDVENQLSESNISDNSVATHLLCLMVRGVFTGLHFPYAHFATAEVTGSSLFFMVWEAIERLERLGFKVIAVTGDGASTNRKLFNIHSVSKDDVCHRVKNPYTTEERYIHFFSDIPHLIKTTRNCWSHSFGHGWTRKLWVSINHVVVCSFKL